MVVNTDGTGSSAHEWQAVGNLFRAYLHQDFVEEYGGASQAVEAWRDEHDPTQLDAAVREIDRLPDTRPDEASLRHTVRDIGSNYRPTDDGLTYRGWLEEVRAVFADGLARTTLRKKSGTVWPIGLDAVTFRNAGQGAVTVARGPTWRP